MTDETVEVDEGFIDAIVRKLVEGLESDDTGFTNTKIRSAVVHLLVEKKLQIEEKDLDEIDYENLLESFKEKTGDAES